MEKHYPKYGLTYFKPDIDNPADRTSIVDGTAPQILLSRSTDSHSIAEVRDRNLVNGVELIDGTVVGINLNQDDGLHAVTVQDPAGGKQTLSARWLVDATGWNRLLAKHLQLHERVSEQKRFLVPVNEFQS